VDEIEPRPRVVASLALLCALAPAACGSGDSASLTADAGATPFPSASLKPGKGITVVGLGDSVPAGGGGCDCVTFVQGYGNLVTARTLHLSTVDNFAVGGTTSGDVVDEMSQPAVQAAVKDATIVLIMTGANDYDDAFDEASIGFDPTAAYATVATVVQDNVTNTIGKIKQLNSKAQVVVLDYWAAEEDGAVAQVQYDAITMAASIACTTSVNAALALAAKAGGATYVSTYTAIKGANGTKDDTDLLGSDGDHPNAAGQLVIAQAIAAVYPKG
jgi:lysophospholipase L1-like esterase